MSVREINFTFAGHHCMRDFGCIYVESGGHAVAPRFARNAYKVAGAPGTQRFPGGVPEEMVHRGTLFPLESDGSETKAQALMRLLSNWLRGAGRDKIIFDYEPDKYYLCEFDEIQDFNRQFFLDGGLRIAMTLQPYAYALLPSTAQGTAGTLTLPLTLGLNTLWPAPLEAEVTNTGTAPITGVTIAAMGKTIAFAGLNLLPTQVLSISQEAPVGAAIGAANAMPYVTSFPQIAFSEGSHEVTVLVTYGTGTTKQATVMIRARGRW